MALTVKRAGADEYGRTLKALIAGDPGAGKTRFSSTFPHPFYANAEGGLMSVADRSVPYADVTSIQDLNELLTALRQTPKAREATLKVPVQTVVIDTLDAIQKMLIDERMRNERKETMAIADWGWLGDQLRLIVRNFRNLEMNVVFTCHVKTVEDSDTGQTFVKPALQGAMGDEIAAYVDIAGLLKASPASVVKDGKTIRVLRRVLQVGPDARHPWLKDRSGRLAIETDINLTNDGVSLLSAIYGGEPVAPTTPVTQAPAAPAQPAPAQRPQAAGKQQAPAPAPEPEAPSLPEGQPDQSSPVQEPEPEQGAGTEELDMQGEAATTPQQPLTQPQQAPSEPEPASTPTETGASATTPPDMICSECGDPIESEDQRDLSLIRFRAPLDKKCFVARKQAKK